MRPSPWIFLVVAFAAVAPPAAAGSDSDLVGPATVREDASLRIRNKIVRLAHLYIPPDGKSCSFILRPARCANRAALALDLKIQGFVHCWTIHRNPDASLAAFCYVDRSFRSEGEDLGAYLLGRGLALAAPGAPFEYVALERIAQGRGLGVWGFQVDDVARRRTR